MNQSAKDGLIFLLHDFEGNEATVEAVDLIIPILKLRGYRFVTVRELFKKKGIKSQKNLIYSKRPKIGAPSIYCLKNRQFT